MRTDICGGRKRSLFLRNSPKFSSCENLSLKVDNAERLINVLNFYVKDDLQKTIYSIFVYFIFILVESQYPELMKAQQHSEPSVGASSNNPPPGKLLKFDFGATVIFP